LNAAEVVLAALAVCKGERPTVAEPLCSGDVALAGGGEMLSSCVIAWSTCSGRADGPALATK